MSEKESVSAAKRSGSPLSLHFDNQKRSCDKMVNHFVAASFLRLYFIIFSSAVSLLRKNARKPPYPHKTFNYIVLGGNPYTHYFCDVFP